MRKAVIFVVVLAVLWAVPGFRGSVAASSLPTLEKLGPVGEFVARPMRRTAATMRTRKILRVMASEYTQGSPIPGVRDFPRWVVARFPDGQHVDPWGSPYWFERTQNMLTVGSSGADGRKGTADDVTHSLPF
jgi:hypothetical protein